MFHKKGAISPKAVGYSISFGVKIFGVNFRVNLGVDFWGLLNDLFFLLFFSLYSLCCVFLDHF